jgi:hypothetical protein
MSDTHSERRHWDGQIVTIDFEANTLTVKVEDMGRVRLGSYVTVDVADGDEETRAILDDPETMAAISEAEADVVAGRVTGQGR